MGANLTILTGASRGMGLALAQQLLQQGDTLICISRHTHDGLTQQARAQGATLAQWPHDLADGSSAAAHLREWLQAQPAEFFASFASATLINNAGVIAPMAPLSASHSAHLAQALRVGLEAPMLLTAAFLAATEHCAPSIVRKVLNISSGLGRRAMASQSAYCAAKAGMDHFTRCLALDEALKPHGAKVCSLAPGVIDTDMQVQLRSADVRDFPDAPNFAALQAAGMLTPPAEAAASLLAWLQRPDFGSLPVADVRLD